MRRMGAPLISGWEEAEGDERAPFARGPLGRVPPARQLLSATAWLRVRVEGLGSGCG